MGLIWNSTKGLAKDYGEETINWKKALIEPGKDVAAVKLGPLGRDEVELICLGLDQLIQSRYNEAVAVAMAEEMESILILARMVKAETKAPFQGALAVGTQLAMMMLRAKDVGGSLLNPAATASCGLYAGTSAAVYTWLHTFTQNSSEYMIPTQTMYQWAGVIHLGLLDTVEVPKINALQWTLAGLASVPQSVASTMKKSTGQTFDVSFARFEKPVIVGPLRSQRLALMPYITGDSKPELVSLLFARAQDLSL
ncbi:MAG: hypothetical protein WC551_08095 [Patescibacteria group bacterium]